jgi:hypothetical protein
MQGPVKLTGGRYIVNKDAINKTHVSYNSVLAKQNLYQIQKLLHPAIDITVIAIYFCIPIFF